MLALAASLACSESAPARPQLVVYVDTTAFVSGQVTADPRLNLQTAFDTVRADVLGPDGEIVDSRELSLPETVDWPMSFGVAADEGTRVEIRLRVFRAADASVSATDVRGDLRGALEPDASVSVDRLLWLYGSAGGIQYVQVVLDADCIGRSVKFGRNAITCIDGERPEAAPSEGIVVLPSPAPPSSRVGTWSLATEVPCTGQPPPGSVCIPGGFSVLGDRDLVGFGDTFLEAAPLHPVYLAPFFMDETEFTVARYEQLASGLSRTPPGQPDAVALGTCTSLQSGGAAAGSPLNCVDNEAAEEMCAHSGGTLPTEAQWEHAARGRQGRTYPWGDTPPSCCDAALCLTEPKPVGASITLPGCDALQDVSRDGVRDLLGNVKEITLDAKAPYSDACWFGEPLLRDPQCVVPGISARVTRGSAFDAALTLSQLPLRGSIIRAQQLPNVGFRCVYPDG